jgi:hypothetical protein
MQFVTIDSWAHRQLLEISTSIYLSATSADIEHPQGLIYSCGGPASKNVEALKVTTNLVYGISDFSFISYSAWK